MSPEDLHLRLPFLEKALLEAVGSEGLIHTFPPNAPLLKKGAYAQGLPIILDGRVKVMLEGEDKDLLLYYIKAGESCIMSFSLCLNHGQSEITAITETDTSLILVPVEKLSRFLFKFPSLSRFMMDLYQKRYVDMLSTVEQLVFFKLDERVLQYLKERSLLNPAGGVQLTHQNIADDLGSSREVISRILKKLELAGKIRQEKNEIFLQE